jgi:hypothetical protein
MLIFLEVCIAEVPPKSSDLHGKRLSTLIFALILGLSSCVFTCIVFTTIVFAPHAVNLSRLNYGEDSGTALFPPRSRNGAHARLHASWNTTYLATSRDAPAIRKSAGTLLRGALWFVLTQLQLTQTAFPVRRQPFRFVRPYRSETVTAMANTLPLLFFTSYGSHFWSSSVIIKIVLSFPNL